MANQQARQDQNKVPALLAHNAVAGTAETRQVVATEGGLNTVIQDSSGNAIDSHLNGDGGYHLGVNATLSGEQNVGRFAFITASKELLVESATRLVGTNFDGTTLDSNFWSDDDCTESGTVTQAGKVTLATGTTANAISKLTSVRTARFVVSSPLNFQAIARWTTAGADDNVRRIGAYDATEGFFFQLDGTTFSIGHRTGSSDTLVNNGSFNGNLGETITFSSSAYYKVEIEWGARGVFWYLNGKLLHSITNQPLVARFSQPITIENINDNDKDDNMEFVVIAAAIVRYGSLLTSPTSYYHATGQTAGVNLKVGAGAIHKIIISNVTNNSVITLSDSITATTPTLFALTSGAQSQPSTIDLGGAPFTTGLRLTVATANASVVVIYE
jgi:hypothetical protein